MSEAAVEEPPTPTPTPTPAPAPAPVEESSPDWLDEPEDLSKQTALHNKYSYWFHRRGGPQNQNNVKTNYEENIIKLGTCHTVEHFWRIHDHVIKPNDIKVTVDYHFFKEGIKPMWEDLANKSGGKWMIRIKKGLSSHYWEEILLAIVGEQFDVGHELCGAVLSIRSGEDIISLWNKNAENVEATNKIRDQMRRILKLPSFVAIEYKKHQDSLIDQSSFRNPTMVWRAPTRPEGGNYGPPHGGNHPYHHQQHQQGGYHRDYHNNNNNNNQGGYYNREGGYNNSNSPRAAGAPAGFRQPYNNNPPPGGVTGTRSGVTPPSQEGSNTNSSSNSNSNSTNNSPRGTDGGNKPASRWDSLNSGSSSSSSSPRPPTAAASPGTNTNTNANNTSTNTSTHGTAGSGGAWRSASGSGGQQAWAKTPTPPTTATSGDSTAASPPAATATDGAGGMGKNLGGWVKSQLIKGQDGGPSEGGSSAGTGAATGGDSTAGKPKFSWSAPK